MDRKTASLITAAAAAAAAPVIAHASPVEGPAIPVASSYADLLQPVPNAVARLRMADAEVAPKGGELIEAQYNGPGPYAHHHHHHHHHNRRWYMQNGYYWHGGQWILRPRHHHHHHHHHNNY